MHRYRCLVRKFWWVLALTLSLCLFAASWYQINRPLTYLSDASVTIDMDQNTVRVGDGQNGGSTNLGPDDYMNLEMPKISSGLVRQMALTALQAKYPDMLASPVKLIVTRDNAIVTLMAKGTNAEYTQRYLQATVNAYLESRRARRDDTGSEAFRVIRDEIAVMDNTLKQDDEAINVYQRKNNVIVDKNDANGANAALVAARQKLESLNNEFSQLTLMTPEQRLKGGGGTSRSGMSNGAAGAQPSPGTMDSGSAAENDFRQANTQLVQLQAQMDDFSQNLRPKHPIIIRIQGQIDAQKKTIAQLLSSAESQVKVRRALVQQMIETAKTDLAAAEKKAFDMNLLRGEVDQLQEKKARDLKHFDDLQNSLTKGMSNNNLTADPVHVMDPVTAAEPVPSSWIKMLGLATVAGLISGVAILALIDRMDDRMGSINDFQLHFSETVLGQIPRDVEVRSDDEDTELLKADDPRHQLVESFRNLRSTLLYMPLEGERPKTLLLTSAVPNEGKSTTSCNLALVMAAAGMKTLLIDADLRRGAIHQKFGITRDPGLTDVLGHNVNWKIAIRQTKHENLHVLPRGRNVPQPSEYLLNKNTDRLLQELYPLYDYIIIDSSPVLAADDTSSLAPKIDATLFVVRMGFTSAKMTRKSLEILYGRQANIPGLILNQVDTSSPEFVYYQYSEYYHTATDDGGGASDGPAIGASKPVKPTVEV